jgi:hypothetical protein
MFLWESFYPENPINRATEERDLVETTPLLISSSLLLLPPPPSATEENLEANLELINASEFPYEGLCLQFFSDWINDFFFRNSRSND